MLANFMRSDEYGALLGSKLMNPTEPDIFPLSPSIPKSKNTVPSKRNSLKPLSINVVNKPSGGRDSFRVFMNNPDTNFRIDKNGNVFDTLVRTKAQDYGDYK